MAEFDPDAYLGTSQQFDPDTYIKGKKPQNLPPLVDRLKRQAGLTGRYLTEGIVGTGDILTSPIRGALNLVLPESLQVKPLAPALTRNLPQPETTMERMVAGPSRALASTLGTGGIGTLARPVSQLGKTIQQAFTANAPTQAAAATGGGLAQSATQELGGDPMTQLAAGLVGTVAGAKILPPKVTGLSTKQLQNVERDKTLELGKQAGYVALPSDVGGGKTGRFLEGMSGKLKAEELASARNQQVTNNLTRKYLGFPEETPLTLETLENARESVYPAYDAIRNTGSISLGNQNPFSNIVTGINKVAGGKNALMQNVPDSYAIDADTAVQRLRELRSDGNAYVTSGTNILKPNPKEVLRGKKYLAEAEKLEKAIENHVTKLGQPELIEQFRDARRYIAKTFTVQKALNPQLGSIDAKKIAKDLGKGAPITDELSVVGKYATAFPKVNKTVPEAPTQLTVADLFSAGVGGPLFGPIRISSRYGLMSQPGQSMFANPQYTPRTAPFVPYQGLLNNQE
jgi:hypothetical protein